MRLSVQTTLLFLTVWSSISASVSLPDSKLICIKAKRSGVEEETWHFAESIVEKVGCEWWGIGLILTLWVSLYSVCTFCHHAPATSFISVTHRNPITPLATPTTNTDRSSLKTHTCSLYCVHLFSTIACHLGPLFCGILLDFYNTVIYALSSVLNYHSGDPLIGYSQPKCRPEKISCLHESSLHHLFLLLYGSNRYFLQGFLLLSP